MGRRQILSHTGKRRQGGKETFPTKKAMADYLKKATEAPASQPKADTTSSNESLKGILD
jgi:hypothetical protein